MNKKILIPILTAFILVFAVSAGFIIKHYTESAKQEALYDSLAEIVETEPDGNVEPVEPIQYTETKFILPEYTELFTQNSDMVGWITVDDTKINYPVMQSKNEPNFYLKHGFDKAYTDYGCPYLQENCDVQEPSDNLIIYGHHILLDGSTVLVESDLKDDNKRKGRRNFTLMHEGSHQIFKRLFPDEYGTAKDRGAPVRCYKVNSENSGRIKDWEEWQANALASATLLPANLIAKGMYLFGLGEKIDCLNKIYRPQEYERFSALADFLGSSRKALAIRMKQLGLVKKEYLDNPFDMISIYK